MKSLVIDYMDAKDKELWAFQWLLNCTNEQIGWLQDSMIDDRSSVDNNFVWALSAIESMAKD